MIPAWLAAEVAEWRRRHTWGGEMWSELDEPEIVRQKPMTGREVMEEVEWLLGGHVHPLMIAQMLHMTTEAIYVAARQDRNDSAIVRAAFAQYQHDRRYRNRSWAAS